MRRRRRINRFRWGTRNPDSTGYRPITWGDYLQREMVKLGFHVISPRRDATALTDEEHALVIEYGALTTAGLVQQYGTNAETTFRELLGRCPFVEPAAIDIDGKCPHETGRLKDIVDELARKHGLIPRWAFSGGSDRPGYHADFGEFQGWPIEQRSLLWLDALRGLFANDARLQALGAKGFYLVGGDPKNCIDLSPANGSQNSRGKIVRALGARYKAGSLNRKELCPGETDEIHPVPVSFLETVPKITPAVSRKGRAAFAQKRAKAIKHYERMPIVIPAGTKILYRVVEVLKTIRKAGHNHEFMLLFSSTIQERFLGADREVWAWTFQAAGFDVEDFRKIWATTIARRKAGAPVKSTTQARQHLGAEVIGRLAAALALDLESSYGEARKRFGYDAYQKHEVEEIIKTPGLDKRISNRLRRILNCRNFLEIAECSDCTKPQYQRREPCDVREACPGCALIRARNVEDWLLEHWAGLEIAVGSRNFKTRELAHAWAQRQQRGVAEGERGARITTPELDGTWTLHIFAKRRSFGAGVAMAAGNYSFISPKKAAALVASLLMRPYDVLRAYFRAGELEKWAALANRMLGAHIITGAKNSSLPWPTQTLLRAIASEHAKGREDYINEDGQVVGKCNCAEDTPLLHSYKHKPSGAMVIEKARHPVSIAELTNYLDEMRRRGLVDELPADPRPLYAFRE